VEAASSRWTQRQGCRFHLKIFTSAALAVLPRLSEKYIFYPSFFFSMAMTAGGLALPLLCFMT
jgi:hypothetical protein